MKGIAIILLAMKNKLTDKSRRLHSLGSIAKMLTALILLSLMPSGYGQALLDVTINSGTVTITSTGLNPVANSSTGNVDTGVELYYFFSTGGLSNASGPITGDLEPSGDGGISYDEFIADDKGGVQSFMNFLQLLNPGESASQIFQTGNAAFSGATSSFSMGVPLADLPGIGTTGPLIDSHSGVQLGQWEVVPVPEPRGLASIGLLVAGTGALHGARGKRTIEAGSKS